MRRDGSGDSRKKDIRKGQDWPNSGYTPDVMTPGLASPGELQTFRSERVRHLPPTLSWRKGVKRHACWRWVD